MYPLYPVGMPCKVVIPKNNRGLSTYNGYWAPPTRLHNSCGVIIKSHSYNMGVEVLTNYMIKFDKVIKQVHYIRPWGVGIGYISDKFDCRRINEKYIVPLNLDVEIPKDPKFKELFI